jgi:Kef-type K+ transport system membrane component KefB
MKKSQKKRFLIYLLVNFLSTCFVFFLLHLIPDFYQLSYKNSIWIVIVFLISSIGISYIGMRIDHKK